MTDETKPGRWIPGGDIKGVQRSLAWLEEGGYTTGVSERWIPRIDHKPDQYAVNLANRLDKIAEELGRGSPFAETITAAEIKLRAIAPGPFYLPGGHREDIWGFADIVAYRTSGTPHTLAVQATSRLKITEHLRKYRRDPKVRQAILDWIVLPGREFVILGWGRREVPNKIGDGTHVRWECVERWVTAEDLAWRI